VKEIAIIILIFLGTLFITYIIAKDFSTWSVTKPIIEKSYHPQYFLKRFKKIDEPSI